ncbi:uncharacterized protein DUF4192 [Stackebrandtia endophytica]|uniref:Uncharacterized protein DUF4192 n=1 Tax=Stackebrandtia endophytica TaxID=1496996 RepID=A0A543AS22_9ACTN|nr:DUF4192 family protein [Stackebrandtia endophytica]TQL75381.1 uncharacterized protein DUF4192 [Stackebrandtia endophytica]
MTIWSKNIRIADSGQLVAAVPHLVGYRPVDEVIVIPFAQGRIASVAHRGYQRVDSTLLRGTNRDGVDATTVVGWASSDATASDVSHRAGVLHRLLTDCGRVSVCLSVVAGDVWSTVTRLDDRVVTRSAWVKARGLDPAVAHRLADAGCDPQRRDRLRDQLAGPGITELDVHIQHAANLARSQPQGFAAAAIHRLDELIRTGGAPDLDDTAVMAVAARNPGFTCEVVTRIDAKSRHAGQHARFWLRVTRDAPPPCRSTVATLLAYAAWRSGDRLLAVEATRATTPSTSDLARFMSEVITQELTPEDLPNK